jgi:hypothetical protein
MHFTTHRERQVKLYVGAVVVASAAALAFAAYLHRTFLIGTWGAEHVTLSGILAFTALGVGLQLAQHRLVASTVHGAISFIVYIASGLVFGPLWGAIITGVSVAAAKVVARQSLVKLAFNVSQLVLAVVVGCAIYLLLDGTIPPDSLRGVVVPFIGFVVGFFGVNSVAVSGVVAVSEQRRFTDVWIRNTWSFAVYDLAASTVSLGIVWLYVHTSLGVLGIAFVVLPILFIRHIYLVNHQLQETNQELLELMVKAIEARDPYTSGHSQRVSDLARVLAQEIGLGYREVQNVTTAALLHDVGKIHEEYAPLLRKEGKLTPEEKRLMDSHALRSSELVSTISNLRGPVEKYVRHHHENYDGTGHPDGLAGDEIPIGARIVAIADTADAMTTDRPYRTAMTYDKVLSVLARYSWKQFDPRLVSAFRTSATIRHMIQSRLLWEATDESSAEVTEHGTVFPLRGPVPFPLEGAAASSTTSAALGQ